jgi:hypothetical protein
MAQNQPLGTRPTDPPGGEPAKTRLGRILAERPEARPRLARAVGSLLGITLVAVAAIGVLLIWHLRRRAGLIRERLTARCDLLPLELELEIPELDADADTNGSAPPSLGSR